MSVDSPCIGVCRLDERMTCLGCHRTVSEITNWYRFNDAEKIRVLEATSARRPNKPRIVSLLPAATEMVYALGLGDHLDAVTHECNFPAVAKTKPVIVRPALDLENLAPRELDAAVSRRLSTGQSLYSVDETLLRRLRPDLVLTQDLCQVCAPSGNELSAALQSIHPKPEVLWMSPRSLEDIFQNILDLGRATDRVKQAEALVTSSRARLEEIATRTRELPRRIRVFFMEWAEPIYCAGHWVPEQIQLAGGFDTLARKGADSGLIDWQDVLDWAPEILIFSPCGFSLAKALEQIPILETLPGWADLPAVRNGRVYAVDADSYFARPGPRVVDGAELLAHLIQPELFPWHGLSDAFHAIRAINSRR